jgi:hypothetical protein
LTALDPVLASTHSLEETGMLQDKGRTNCWRRGATALLLSSLASLGSAQEQVPQPWTPSTCDGSIGLPEWGANATEWVRKAEGWTQNAGTTRALGLAAAEAGLNAWSATGYLWSADNAISANTANTAWATEWVLRENDWMKSPDPWRSTRRAWMRQQRGWEHWTAEFEDLVDEDWASTATEWVRLAGQFNTWQAQPEPNAWQAQSAALKKQPRPRDAGVEWVFAVANGAWDAASSVWSTSDWVTDANAAVWTSWTRANAGFSREWMRSTKQWSRDPDPTPDQKKLWAALDKKWLAGSEEWTSNLFPWKSDSDQWGMRSTDWAKDAGGWRRNATRWAKLRRGDWTEAEKVETAWHGVTNVWSVAGDGVWTTANGFWLNRWTRTAVGWTWTNLCQPWSTP